MHGSRTGVYLGAHGDLGSLSNLFLHLFRQYCRQICLTDLTAHPYTCPHTHTEIFIHMTSQYATTYQLQEFENEKLPERQRQTRFHTTKWLHRESVLFLMYIVHTLQLIQWMLGDTANLYINMKLPDWLQSETT